MFNDDTSVAILLFLSRNQTPHSAYYANLALLLCRCAAGGRASLPGRDAGDGGGPAATNGRAGQAGRTPAHLPAVPAAGARPTRGLQEAPRLPRRRSMVSQILPTI